uniref:Uncharacterized protein n=1 Tax=Coccidioides posadasii RMSCC 3488 TaxID=454284 RepID=A0A0J6FKH4_COCPO|nr:hypothetical protein CPAG_07139 [Coccidioides posadasii RMSCC 3488]
MAAEDNGSIPMVRCTRQDRHRVHGTQGRFATRSADRRASSTPPEQVKTVNPLSWAAFDSDFGCTGYVSDRSHAGKCLWIWGCLFTPYMLIAPSPQSRLLCSHPIAFIANHQPMSKARARVGVKIEDGH